jgi:hypothetical protein
MEKNIAICSWEIADSLWFLTYSLYGWRCRIEGLRDEELGVRSWGVETTE